MLNVRKKKENNISFDFLRSADASPGEVEEVIPPRPPINAEDVIQERVKNTFEKKKVEEPPVISTYNQVKFDIYMLFQDFSKAYGSYKALERIGRAGKELKQYESLMTSYSLQFHGLVESGWDKTKLRMKNYDRRLMGEQVVAKYGDLWTRFVRICYAANDGGHLFDPEKYKYKPYYFDKPDFSLANIAISRFLQFSGITAIEGRFQDEKSEFGYGG